MTDDFERAIEGIYAPWRDRHAHSIGLLDRDRRFPDRLIRLADRLRCLPVPERTIVVTGSKGKGSTVRLIAWALQRQGYRVGMVLSPHERSHHDRIRINNTPVSDAQFVRQFKRLEPSLTELLQFHPSPYYPAPSGLFLLTGLLWFADAGVDYWVIEAGRGGGSDEAAHLGADTAVVSSVFDEHLAVLGPGMTDLIEEKLAVGRMAQRLVVSQQVFDCAVMHAIELEPKVAVAASSTPYESWLSSVVSLAEKTLAALGIPQAVVDQKALMPPIYQTGSGKLQLLPWIHPVSVEAHRLKRGSACVLAVTVDKKIDDLAAALGDIGCHYWLHISGDSPTSREPQGFEALGQVDLQGDGHDLRNALIPLMGEHGLVNLIGNQQLMALARRAFDIPILGPSA